MRLLLARHGQSVWNADRRFQGRTDVGLSPKGTEEAISLGRAVARRPLAAVYASPLARARQTAEIVVRGTGLTVTVAEDLKELSLGAWEGRTVDDVLAAEGEAYRQWLRQPFDCPPPGGEHVRDVAGRVLPVMERIAARHPDGEELLVVAHGGVISVYLCHLLGLTFNALWRMAIHNGSLTVVDPPRVLTLNDTTHLKS